MECRQYIFLLTSDQLVQASLPDALAARGHRLMCRHCRAFTRNDQRLLEALGRRQEDTLAGFSPPGRS